MVLRLDPHLPVVWRTPTSLQFGVTRPPVSLDTVTVATEKLIAALSVGVSHSGLSMIGRSAGASDAEIEALLTLLAPVLVSPPRESQASVVVAGTGRLADRVAAVLAEARIRVVVARTVAEAERASGSLAIIVGHFVLDPGFNGLWLRRDLPHLPVVLGDSSVAIGPFIEPGSTACLYCLQRHANDADAAWPAIASQLWGRRSPLDTELVTSEVAAIVARLVLAQVRGEAGVASDQLIVDPVSGERSHRQYAVHPACGCRELATPSAEDRRESDSAIDADRVRFLPTTGKGASARA